MLAMHALGQRLCALLVLQTFIQCGKERHGLSEKNGIPKSLTIQTLVTDAFRPDTAYVRQR